MAEDERTDGRPIPDRASGSADAAGESSRRIRRPGRLTMAWLLLKARLYFPFYFQSLRLANAERLPKDVEGPLIIYMNHSSWWDPLPMLLLQIMLLPKRVLHAPSDADALSKGNVLPKIGFFPVERGTMKGTRQFLRDCSYILAQKNTVLCITPEGAFKDGRIRPLELERGLAALLARTREVTVVPLAMEYTLWDRQRPELLASWGEPIRIDDGRSKSVDEWQAVLTEALTATMDELADLSIRRETWRFRALIYGRMGLRNIKALLGDLKRLYDRDR